MKRVLADYENGNYRVTLFSDGTKIKRTEEDFFRADFPDSIDLKITNYCENACPMCHESSGKNGEAGNLYDEFLNTVPPGVEVAIGGGDPLSHPDLVPFLRTLKKNGVVANVTVHALTLEKKRALLTDLLSENLVWGVGVSCLKYDPKAIAFADEHENVVLHLINGVFPTEDYPKIYGKRRKILLLGYKNFGRGKTHYSEEVRKTMEETKAALPEILKNFGVTSFDNLALEQLNVKERIGEELFDRIYMGDDGDATMYVDLVKREYAISSTAEKRYPLQNGLRECFLRLQKERSLR